MNMTWHNAPGIYLKPFLLLAMLPAFYHFIFVFVSGKNIYPVYCGKTDEIHFVPVPKFIFTAHALKLQQYKARFTKGVMANNSDYNNFLLLLLQSFKELKKRYF